MSATRKQPHSARVLEKWVDAHARERGLAPKRVRDWISYMVLAGRLEQANSEVERAAFTIKGAVALEMRLPESARATKDIDVIAEAEDERGLAEVLAQALAVDYQNFTFRIKDDPYVMPNDSLRFQVALEYKARSWSTVQVDLSRGEGDTTEVELVDPLALEPFGLDTPPALPCLSLRYHLAQKIHGMTQPPKGDEEANERFRDLADLLLIRKLAPDLASVREACVEVFALRGTHAWPPAVEPPDVWEEPFAALAAELELPVSTLVEAVEAAAAFIGDIEVPVDTSRRHPPPVTQNALPEGTPVRPVGQRVPPSGPG